MKGVFSVIVFYGWEQRRTHMSQTNYDIYATLYSLGNNTFVLIGNDRSTAIYDDREIQLVLLVMKPFEHSYEQLC